MQSRTFLVVCWSLWVGWAGGLLADSPVEEALWTAQRVLLSREETRHPCYWAGFIVMRGPR